MGANMVEKLQDIDLPDPKSLLFPKNRYDLFKAITILKIKTQYQTKQRSLLNLQVSWCKKYDISKSIGQKNFTNKQLYEIILAGYNHFKYNLEEDFFKVAYDGTFRKLLSSTKQKLLCNLIYELCLIKLKLIMC